MIARLSAEMVDSKSNSTRPMQRSKTSEELKKGGVRTPNRPVKQPELAPRPAQLPPYPSSGHTDQRARFVSKKMLQAHDTSDMASLDHPNIDESQTQEAQCNRLPTRAEPRTHHDARGSSHPAMPTTKPSPKMAFEKQPGGASGQFLSQHQDRLEDEQDVDNVRMMEEGTGQ